MTTYTHRFMVVPVANLSVAQSLVRFFANTVVQGTADGMFQVGCNTLGTGITTDLVSHGLIDAQFASLLGDANATYAAYQAKGGTTITLPQIQALYIAAPLGTRIRSDLNYDGGGQAGLTALGLKLIAGTL